MTNYATVPATSGGDASILDRLEQLFNGPGTQLYLGEPVTIADHMLQCAALAQAQGAPEALVGAALLHDIGHLSAEEDNGSSAVDWKHEESGAAILEGHCMLLPSVICVRPTPAISTNCPTRPGTASLCKVGP